jgi:hypothetical protein
MYKLSLALMALMALTFWSGNAEARVISAFGNQVGQDSEYRPEEDKRTMLKNMIARVMKRSGSFGNMVTRVMRSSPVEVQDVYPQMADKHQHLNEERELEELLTMIVINQMKAEQESKL